MKIDLTKEQLSGAMDRLELTRRSRRTIMRTLRYRNGSVLLGTVGIFVAVQLLLMIPLVVTDIDDVQIQTFLKCGIPVLSILLLIHAFSILREAACARAFIELLAGSGQMES